MTANVTLLLLDKSNIAFLKIIFASNKKFWTSVCVLHINMKNSAESTMCSHNGAHRTYTFSQSPSFINRICVSHILKLLWERGCVIVM
jgi:hypothetical protein